MCRVVATDGVREFGDELHGISCFQGDRGDNLGAEKKEKKKPYQYCMHIIRKIRKSVDIMKWYWANTNFDQI